MRTAFAAAMVLALAALSPAPLAAQSSPYDDAVASRTAGDPGRAVRLLEPWLAAHSDDVDARLQFGFALLALGRLDEAEAAFDAVLIAAPDYRDAEQGLAAIERRRGEPATRQRSFFLIEGAWSDLDGNRGDWHEEGISFALPVGRDGALLLQGTHYGRFGLDDLELRTHYTHHAGLNAWLRVGASVTPSADFRPEIGFNAGVDYRIAGGRTATVATLDTSWQRFPLQDVWTVSPGLTKYLADGLLSFTARANGVVADGGPLRIGGSLRGDYLPANRMRLYLGAAAGPDTDVGIVTTTRSLFGGGEIPVSSDISLLASVAREWRDGPGDRTELRFGLKLGL